MLTSAMSPYPLTILAVGLDASTFLRHRGRFSRLAVVTNPYRGPKLEKETVTLSWEAQERPLPSPAPQNSLAQRQSFFHRNNLLSGFFSEAGPGT